MALRSYSRDAVIKDYISIRQAGFARVSLAYVALNSDLPTVALLRSKLITIDCMLKEGAEYIHVDKFLLARCIVPPVMDLNNSNSALCVIDDPTGEKALPFYFINSSNLEPGVLIALMNPLLTTIPLANKSQKEVLLSDNPAHILVLRQGHPVLRGFRWNSALPEIETESPGARWKEAGNLKFKNQKYDEALFCYTRALAEDGENALLYSNRSATFTMLNKHDEALQDAEKGLTIEKTNKKLLFRKAKSLFQLKRYHECWVFMMQDQECKRHMIDRDFAVLLSRANQRCRELMCGDYDLMALCSESRLMGGLDHADYFDKTMLAIKPVPGCDLGVVALRRIPSGALICACKATVFTHLTSTPDFTSLLTKKLSEDASFSKFFFQLYAGSSLQRLHTWDPRQVGNEDQRIKNIASSNYFKGEGRENSGAGFWLLPSFFNFTCVDSNCDRYIIGDFLFIRSTRDIASGEQLLLQLYPTCMQYEQRAAFYTEKRGFRCRCRLCTVESSECPSARIRIRYIHAKLEAFEIKSQMSPVNPTDVVSEFTELINEAKSLRPDSSMDPLSTQLNYVITKMKVMAGKYKESHKINKELLLTYESFGWILDAIKIALVLSLNGAMAGASADETNSCKLKLRNLARLYYGDENLLNSLAPAELFKSVNSMKFNDGFLGGGFPSNFTFGN